MNILQYLNLTKLKLLKIPSLLHFMQNIHTFLQRLPGPPQLEEALGPVTVVKRNGMQINGLGIFAQSLSVLPLSVKLIASHPQSLPLLLLIKYLTA